MTENLNPDDRVAPYRAPEVVAVQHQDPGWFGRHESSFGDSRPGERALSCARAAGEFVTKTDKATERCAHRLDV